MLLSLKGAPNIHTYLQRKIYVHLTRNPIAGLYSSFSKIIKDGEIVLIHLPYRNYLDLTHSDSFNDIKRLFNEFDTTNFPFSYDGINLHNNGNLNLANSKKGRYYQFSIRRIKEEIIIEIKEKLKKIAVNFDDEIYSPRAPFTILKQRIYEFKNKDGSKLVDANKNSYKVLQTYAQSAGTQVTNKATLLNILLNLNLPTKFFTGNPLTQSQKNEKFAEMVINKILTNKDDYPFLYRLIMKANDEQNMRLLNQVLTIYQERAIVGYSKFDIDNFPILIEKDKQEILMELSKFTPILPHGKVSPNLLDEFIAHSGISYIKQGNEMTLDYPIPNNIPKIEPNNYFVNKNHYTQLVQDQKELAIIPKNTKKATEMRHLSAFNTIINRHLHIDDENIDKIAAIYNVNINIEDTMQQFNVKREIWRAYVLDMYGVDREEILNGVYIPKRKINEFKEIKINVKYDSDLGTIGAQNILFGFNDKEKNKIYEGTPFLFVVGFDRRRQLNEIEEIIAEADYLKIVADASIINDVDIDILTDTWENLIISDKGDLLANYFAIMKEGQFSITNDKIVFKNAKFKTNHEFFKYIAEHFLPPGTFRDPRGGWITQNPTSKRTLNNIILYGLIPVFPLKSIRAERLMKIINIYDEIIKDQNALNIEIIRRILKNLINTIFNC